MVAYAFHKIIWLAEMDCPWNITSITVLLALAKGTCKIHKDYMLDDNLQLWGIWSIDHQRWQRTLRKANMPSDL